MPHIIFDKATKKYIGGAKWDIPVFDPITQVHLKLVDYPTDNDRLNATEDGIRPVTQAELDADITAGKDALADINKLSPWLKAYALAINKGTIIPGSKMTPAQLKAAVRALL